MATGIRKLIFGERSITKIAALYASPSEADAARARMLAAGWSQMQVVRLNPADARESRRSILGRGMAPESHGIFRTLLRAHLFTGIVGLAVGVAAWLTVRTARHPFIADSPTLSLIAFAFFGTVVGLMVGGLISLRPDHSRLINNVRESLRSGDHAVIAHPFDEKQAEQAVETLRSGSRRVERTL